MNFFRNSILASQKWIWILSDQSTPSINFQLLSPPDRETVSQKIEEDAHRYRDRVSI